MQLLVILMRLVEISTKLHSLFVVIIIFVIIEDVLFFFEVVVILVVMGGGRMMRLACAARPRDLIGVRLWLEGINK